MNTNNKNRVLAVVATVAMLYEYREMLPIDALNDVDECIKKLEVIKTSIVNNNIPF